MHMTKCILYFYELLFCIYVYICYRGPLGRLAKLAKGAILWKYCINKLMLCLKGKKSNKILVALALFLWSHKYFVISNFDQNCVSACYLFK